MSKLLDVYGFYGAIRNILFKCETHEQLYKAVCGIVVIINEKRIEALQSNDLMSLNAWTTLYIWATNLKEEVGHGNYSKVFGITLNISTKSYSDNKKFIPQPNWFLNGNISTESAWKHLYSKLLETNFWIKSEKSDKIKWIKSFHSLLWLILKYPKIFMNYPTDKELALFIRAYFEIDFSDNSIKNTRKRIENEGETDETIALRRIMTEFESTIYYDPILDNETAKDIAKNFMKMFEGYVDDRHKNGDSVSE